MKHFFKGLQRLITILGTRSRGDVPAVGVGVLSGHDNSSQEQDTFESSMYFDGFSTLIWSGGSRYAQEKDFVR